MKAKIKAEDRLKEIIEDNILTIGGVNIDIPILTQAILKEFIHIDELPEEKEEKGLNLSPEKSWFQGFNQCLVKIKKLRGDNGYH